MLVKSIAFSLLALASQQLLAAQCATTIDSTDQMTFSTKTIEVSKTCKTFTVTLTHSGSLPKTVMGHNWVLSKESDAQMVATDGVAAGLEKNYLKDGDARVIAHTRVIGGHEKDEVTVNLSRLDSKEKYQFFCSFPGHISMMKGSFVLVD